MEKEKEIESCLPTEDPDPEYRPGVWCGAHHTHSRSACQLSVTRLSLSLFHSLSLSHTHPTLSLSDLSSPSLRSAPRSAPHLGDAVDLQLALVHDGDGVDARCRIPQLLLRLHAADRPLANAHVDGRRGGEQDVPLLGELANLAAPSVDLALEIHVARAALLLVLFGLVVAVALG